MKEVYHIEKVIKYLRDRRINPKYSTAEAILPVLFGFLIRIQSFNELKYRLKSKDFKNIISRKMKLPQIDTIRDTIKVVDNQRLSKMHNNIIKKAKQNKVLRKGTIDGYAVAAIDGTKLFGSNKKNCIECCKTKTRNNRVYHFYNAAFMSLISTVSNLIQLFICRRLKSYGRKQFTQKEIIRLLTKELYLLKYDKKYIFNTT